MVFFLVLTHLFQNYDTDLASAGPEVSSGQAGLVVSNEPKIWTLTDM